MPDGSTPVARLRDALDGATDLYARRKAALKAATRYASGTRYAGAERVSAVADRFVVYLAGTGNDRSLEAQRAREEALAIAIGHLCRPSSNVSVERVLAAAKAFENFLTLEGV